MSARSRAVPWFGTKGARSVEPECPAGLTPDMLFEAAWLRQFTPTPEEAKARAQEAFVAATLRMFELAEESARWHDEIARA
jgi:hypothetical protein